MPKLTPHEISVRTRRSIFAVIKKYNLDPRMLGTYGLIDRIIHGYVHAIGGNVLVDWPNELPADGAREYHIITKVVPERDIPGKGTPEYRKKMKWRRPYKVGGKFVLDDGFSTDIYDAFVFDEIGRDYTFTLRGSTEKIHGHSCEDQIFQTGLKAIPTACYHICAVRFAAPVQLNDNVERAVTNRERGVRFVEEYDEIEQELVDLYNEMLGHNLKAWQRLNILYACSKGELGMFRFGKAFRKSVEPYLKEPIEGKK